MRGGGTRRPSAGNQCRAGAPGQMGNSPMRHGLLPAASLSAVTELGWVALGSVAAVVTALFTAAMAIAIIVTAVYAKRRLSRPRMIAAHVRDLHLRRILSVNSSRTAPSCWSSRTSGPRARLMFASPSIRPHQARKTLRGYPTVT